MSCKYQKIRSKKYQKYFYCNHPDIKSEIDKDDCDKCKLKEYKEIKPIKGKKKDRTKATDIQQGVKQIVWERDNHQCIFCHKNVPMDNANAHFIKRSQGGLGIPMNIFTACDICHYEEDHGLECLRYEDFAEQYLKNYYGEEWSKDKLIYNKWEENWLWN